MKLMRFSQLVLVALLVLLSMGAADMAARYNKLGHSMMCTCGCNQILMECNHVSCPNSPHMLAELHADLSHGDSDTVILKLFQAKYGPTVLAAPMFTRFNDAAWFAPPLVLLLGIASIVIVVRKWRLRTVAMPADPVTPALIQIRDQIRKETEL